MLDRWFGEDKVVDEYEFVSQYRMDTNTTGGVSYKLYTFPEMPGLGVVSIRGSEAAMDWIVDAQLWSTAALVQVVRAVIPLGWIFTPVLDNLVRVVSLLQNYNLKEVSYYTRTTRFVNDMLSGAYNGTKLNNIRVTGASLGGGISIITGAQTGAPTVAISGINAMLSRKTFTPELTASQLNTRVFNVIPDRDIIARIDDKGALFQEIQCRAPVNSLMGCHSMWRSLCEIQYQCGSGGRPIICWCATKYGYPIPKQSGNQTWKEVCAKDYEGVEP